MMKFGIRVALLISCFTFSILCIANENRQVGLTRINDQIWVHTSFYYYNGVPIPSNGLIVVTKQGLVMVDTCWDNKMTTELMAIAKDKFKQDFIMAIITHGAHEDRIGGIDALLAKGIEVRSTRLTMQKAKQAGFKEPVPSLDAQPSFTIGDVTIETFYPGPGHSVDNIVIWFPAGKVLFGGCLIKSADSNNLGNVADADVKEWPNSLRKLLQKYPDATVVVPGHGQWGDAGLIRHTLQLFETH